MRPHATTWLTTFTLLFAMALPHGAWAVSCYPQIAASTPNSDFDIMTDGTARHQPTGLTWMRCNLGQSWNGTTCIGDSATFTLWDVVMRTARDINTGDSDLDGDGAPGFANENDWRVPNIKEWQSINEVCRHTPALNDAVFLNAPLAASYFSSTSVDEAPLMAWAFSSQFGAVGYIRKHDAIPYVIRLVRGGQGGGEYAGTGRLFANGFE